MKRLLITLLCFGLPIFGYTQIATAEYFIDTDPGVGNATTLTFSGNVIDQGFSISTSGLSEGVHSLHVRAINDDGSWSLYAKNVFYVNPNNSNSANIASAEYFIDTDPGVGNGTALTVTGNVIDENLSVPTSGLSEGIHSLHIRLINDDGASSLYAKNVFYVNPNNSNSANIASAEYFIDIDPGVGNGNALSISGNVIDQNFTIPTSGLSDGVHKLYVRVLNDDGTWCLYDKNVFYVSQNNSNTALITAAEYFYDIDPGIGNATPIDLSDAENIDEDLELDVPADLPAGDHFLYMRVQNIDGNWSLYAPAEAEIPLSTSLRELEHFKFYPNPVKDVLHLDVQNQKIIAFKVINLYGKIVMDKRLIENQIDLSRLNSGVYLFHLKTDAGIVSKKFIKK